MAAVDLGSADAPRQLFVRDGVGGDGGGNFALLGAASGAPPPGPQRAGLVAVVVSEERARTGGIVGALVGTLTPTRLSFEVLRYPPTADDDDDGEGVGAYDRTVDLLAVADPRSQLFVAPVGEALPADGGLFWTTRWTTDGGDDDDDNGDRWSVPSAGALAHAGSAATATNYYYGPRVWTAPQVSELGSGSYVRFRPNAVSHADAMIGFDARDVVSQGGGSCPEPAYAVIAVGPRDAQEEDTSCACGGTVAPAATGPVLYVVSRTGASEAIEQTLVGAWSAGDLVEVRYYRDAGDGEEGSFETLLNGAPVPGTERHIAPSLLADPVAFLSACGGVSQTFAHVDAVLVDAADGSRHASAAPLRRTPPLLLPEASSSSSPGGAAAVVATPPRPGLGESQELTAAQVAVAFPDLGFDPETDAGGWNARLLRVRAAHAADARAEVVGVAEPFLVFDRDGGQHFPCYASAARAASDPYADPAGTPRTIDLGSGGTYHAAAVDTATHYAYAGDEPILSDGLCVGPRVQQPVRL